VACGCSLGTREADEGDGSASYVTCQAALAPRRRGGVLGLPVAALLAPGRRKARGDGSVSWVTCRAALVPRHRKGGLGLPVAATVAPGRRGNRIRGGKGHSARFSGLQKAAPY